MSFFRILSRTGLVRSESQVLVEGASMSKPSLITPLGLFKVVGMPFLLSSAAQKLSEV